MSANGRQDDQDQDRRSHPRPLHAGFAVRRVPGPEPDGAWLAPTISLGQAAAPLRGGTPGEVGGLTGIDPQLRPDIEAIPSMPAAEVGGRRPVGPDPEKTSRLATAKREMLEQRHTKKGQGRADQTKACVARASTQADYLKRGAGLLRRYRHQNKIAVEHEDIDPVDFVNWLFSLKYTVAPNSWRVYRAAMIATVQIMPHDRVEEAVALIETDIGVESDEARSKQRGRRAGVTPLPRARTVSKEHFDRMVGAVTMFSRSERAPILQDWLIAGIHTGLRPIEWALADLEVRQDPTRFTGRRAWLHVVNAKATNGRANGTTRTLDISGFSDETFGAVERLVRAANQWTLEKKFSAEFSRCQQICYEMSFALFPRLETLYSLYTLRHQFIANMKRVYDRETVAALVGHRTVETQVEHDGKQRQGWMDHEIKERPVAMPDQVAQVRQTMKLFDEHTDVRMARKALSDRRAQAALDGNFLAKQAMPPSREGGSNT
jgi:hypothetical protein